MLARFNDLFGILDQPPPVFFPVGLPISASNAERFLSGDHSHCVPVATVGKLADYRAKGFVKIIDLVVYHRWPCDGCGRDHL
jgi:hypothetical protein